MELYKHLVIGVDQSYSRCGISIAADGKLLKVTSTSFKGCTSKSAKRKHLANIIQRAISQNAAKAKLVTIIVERIRTFSGGGKESFLSMGYIKATAALIATIVDVAEEHGVKVWSVDTRSWKAQVVGSSKRVKGDPKLLTVVYVEGLGFDLTTYNRKGIANGKDNDAADSACIALYAYVPKDRRSLKREE